MSFVTAVEEYGSVAYGWAMEDTSHFVKLLADPDDGRLLGAHLIGPQASTLIQPLIQAMTFGLAGPGDGPRSVLDPPRADRGGRERPAELPLP